MSPIEIKIVYQEFENNTSFFKNAEKRIETLSVTYSQKNNKNTIYKVKFKDIGLDSKFGEIEIENNEGFWKKLDDSSQINIITNAITDQLIIQNV